LTVTSPKAADVSSTAPAPLLSVPVSTSFLASASTFSPAPFPVPPSDSFSVPLAQTPSLVTVTPVPIISSALSPIPVATFRPNGATQPGSGGSKGFDALSNQNLAVYYGQTPATARTSLTQLCENSNVDIVILAFLTEFFGPGGFPTVNFGATCGGQTSEMKSVGASGLLHCPELASQISQCQSLGKKVLLSLGGALAVSAFPSEGQASEFATTLWNLFGAGTGVDPGLRPFGSVTLDGFDVGMSPPWPLLPWIADSFRQRGSQYFRL
jgi:chitinase